MDPKCGFVRRGLSQKVSFIVAVEVVVDVEVGL